ncbi:MAG: hypothetical protein ABUK01_17805 [Leptospirales bacterium]
MSGTHERLKRDYFMAIAKESGFGSFSGTGWGVIVRVDLADLE